MNDIICPHCRKPVYDEEALSCHFCGGPLGRASSGGMGKLRGNKWLWITVAVLIAAAMALTMF